MLTPDEVKSINAYQQSGAFHSLTCGECSTDLVAEREGLRCPEHGIVQSECPHEWIADWSWQTMGIVWQPSMTLRTRLAKLERVATTARAIDAMWAKRFGCTVDEMEAEIAKFPKAFSEQVLWVALARALAALEERVS